MATVKARLGNSCVDLRFHTTDRVKSGLNMEISALYASHLHQCDYSISLMLTIMATDSIHSSHLYGSVNPQFIPGWSWPIIP